MPCRRGRGHRGLTAFFRVPAMERARGFEPPTFCLGSRHSATELRPRRSNLPHSTKRRFLYQPHFGRLCPKGSACEGCSALVRYGEMIAVQLN